MSQIREFENPYEEYHNSKQLIDVNDPQKWLPEISDSLKRNLMKFLCMLEKKLPDGIDWFDYTVFSGTSGISLLYFHLSNIMLNERKNSFFDKALYYAEKSLSCLKHHHISFLNGNAGPLAIAAVIYSRAGKLQQSMDLIYSLEKIGKSIISLESGLSDELLYGRAGYLYALLYIQKYIGKDSINHSLIQEVTSIILKSGKKISKNGNHRSPLMYSWHEKNYLGAAHGLGGILYILLQKNVSYEKIPSSIRLLPVMQTSRKFIPLVKPLYQLQRIGNGYAFLQLYQLTNEKRHLWRALKAKNYMSSEEFSLIEESIDYLLHTRFPSGNFPSSLDNKDDYSVQWCNGAPGIIHLLGLAYKSFGKQRYLDAAKQCGDLIWRKGLLKKGYGICHGISGNGYAFLQLYQLTNEKRHLWRALKFADWCCDYGNHGCPTPDHPLSLFEGLAGTVYFIADLLIPDKAALPGYQL